MKTVDLFTHKRAKKKVEELEEVLKVFDFIADMLYNNLGHSGIWSLLKHVEELRIQYNIEHYEWSEILKQRKEYGKK